MKILLETPKEEHAMRVPEIHLTGLVEAIKTNGLDEHLEVLVLNSPDVTKCEHEHTIKAISIPITNDGTGELDYDELLKIVQKIVSKDTDPGFTWFEVLACIDCDTVLEQMDVFIPDLDMNTEIIHLQDYSYLPDDTHSVCGMIIHENERKVTDRSKVTCSKCLEYSMD